MSDDNIIHKIYFLKLHQGWLLWLIYVQFLVNEKSHQMIIKTMKSFSSLLISAIFSDVEVNIVNVAIVYSICIIIVIIDVRSCQLIFGATIFFYDNPTTWLTIHVFVHTYIQYLSNSTFSYYRTVNQFLLQSPREHFLRFLSYNFLGRKNCHSPNAA